MCRNIKPLHNFEPPTTDDEIRAAALQFVRKISGYNKPSAANRAAFDAAVEEIAAVSGKLLGSLVTTSPPRDRAEQQEKARELNKKRFGGAKIYSQSKVIERQKEKLAANRR